MLLLRIIWPFWAAAAGVALIADEAQGIVLQVVLGAMACCLVVLPVWAFAAKD